jgi:hypothetical protein
MRRDALLPDEQLSLVVTALYADADARGWATLPLADRSRAYGDWVEDERVGGILTKYMTPEATRSWIKDGPMKEYSRAARGTGRYARYGRQGGTGPADVVITVLGQGATVVDGSVGVKPSHCQAVDAAGETVYLAWGEAKNFRNLLFAALSASLKSGQDAYVVVMEPPGRATTTDDVLAHKAFAERCGLGIHHMRERLGDRRAGSDG